MKSKSREIALHELREIPGVGKSISVNFWDMGITSIAKLKGRNPQKLYERLCEMEGTQVDRCALYVFRCAVYFASNANHDPELLKWWNWSDENLERNGAPRDSR